MLVVQLFSRVMMHDGVPLAPMTAYRKDWGCPEMKVRWWEDCLQRHRIRDDGIHVTSSSIQTAQPLNILAYSRLLSICVSSGLFSCSSTLRYSLSQKQQQPAPRILSEGTPDWIEKWSPEVFRKVGYGMAAGVVAAGALGSPATGAVMAVPVGLYWWIGLRDLKQESHTLKRNFPVLANAR